MIVTLVDPYRGKQEHSKGEIVLSAAMPSKLTRKGIIGELVKQNLVGEDYRDGVLVSSSPRNYFIDLVLSRGMELFYDSDRLEQGDGFGRKRLVPLPISFQLQCKNEEFHIDSQVDVITLKYFTVLQKIGEGTYSEIFLVESKYDRQLFCLKRINKAELREKGSFEMVKNEYEILQYGSKYKIKLYYQFEDARYVYLIVDYCPYGDLYSIMRKMRKNEEVKMTLAEKYMIWMQIAFGIVSLHQKGLIYRDLKPENILIDENQTVKICDFGFTCKIAPSEKMSSLCGSYQYLAPEVITREGYDKSMDVYCLGLLFYQLLVGVNPFEGITPKNMHEMKNKPINFQKKNISNTVKNLLKKMLKERPEERIGYQCSLDIFRHQFFKENQDLVEKVIRGKARIQYLKYADPPSQPQRKELDIKQALIFPKNKAYNYLKPFFDVTENVGPKFQST